jgi:hypothetical protein
MKDFIGAAVLAVAGAYVLYLLLRIAHDIHTDRQVAKHIKERDAALSQSAAAVAQPAEAEHGQLDPRTAAEQARTMLRYVEAFNGQKFDPTFDEPDRQNLATALDNLLETAAMLSNMADRVATPIAAQPGDLHMYTLSEAARFLRARGNPTGADDMQLLWDARMVAPGETSVFPAQAAAVPEAAAVLVIERPASMSRPWPEHHITLLAGAKNLPVGAYRLSASEAPKAREAAVPEAVADVLAERARQDAQWGGPAHDNEHTWGEWCQYIEHQVRKMAKETNDSERPRFVKIAALAVAAIESIDRLGAPEAGAAPRFGSGVGITE